MQSQGVTENIDAARRDSRLLRMAFRRARQAGDYRGALAASQLGGQMGLQIGTPVHDEAIKGLGMKRFGDKMEMDRRFGGPLGSGMDQSAQDAQGQQQLGVGGYDFNQQYGSPLAPRQQQPSTLDLQRAVARRKWQMAKTTEEKDAITEESAAKGLTTNPSAVQDALMRRRGNFGVPQLAAVGGSQQQTAASETVPWRPNSQMATSETSAKSLDSRDVLYSKPSGMDASFGVPSLQSRRFDMRGRGVRQNPEFSPAADKAFAEKQAAEKAASNTEIQRGYNERMSMMRGLRENQADSLSQFRKYQVGDLVEQRTIFDPSLDRLAERTKGKVDRLQRTDAMLSRRRSLSPR